MKQGFEDSLWDLKPFSGHINGNVNISLKIPYGIWNAIPKAAQWLPLSRLKIPYGIWNAKTKRPSLISNLSLKIPYGIWNSRHQTPAVA